MNDDLIRRSDAMKAVCWDAEAISAIETLPSVQSERKKGKWIPRDYNKSDGMITTAVYYFPKCSVCGVASNYTNFCPYCGADMRG